MNQTRRPVAARESIGQPLGAERGLAGTRSRNDAVRTQGETVEEVRQNLAEVIALLREEGALQPESEFIVTTPLVAVSPATPGAALSDAQRSVNLGTRPAAEVRLPKLGAAKGDIHRRSSSQRPGDPSAASSGRRTRG